jgi:hypothetical protein
MVALSAARMMPARGGAPWAGRLHAPSTGEALDGPPPPDPTLRHATGSPIGILKSTWLYFASNLQVFKI